MKALICLDDTWDNDSSSVSNVLSKSLSLDSFLDHGAENSQHGSTSLVQFKVELGLEFFSFQSLSQVAGSVVSRVVRGVPDASLHESNGQKDLEQSSSRDGEDSGETIRDVGELDAEGRGEVSRELDSGVVDKHTNDGNHGNTSVLALNGTTTLWRDKDRFKSAL